MAKRKITCKLLVIGGSAGSLDVLIRVLPKLNTQLSFPIIIVVHRKYTEVSTLSNLLSAKTKLAIRDAEDKEPLMPGTIYLAPSDYHLLVEDNESLSLDYSEKINYSRPSIDVTFETAVDVFKQHTVGVLLSGANMDGVNGLLYIKKLKGYAVVQDPNTAQSPFMPQQAIEEQAYDIILNIEELSSFINNLSA
jgi:two-component system chemotaxis response regulator CheB